MTRSRPAAASLDRRRAAATAVRPKRCEESLGVGSGTAPGTGVALVAHEVAHIVLGHPPRPGGRALEAAAARTAAAWGFPGPEAGARSRRRG